MLPRTAPSKGAKLCTYSAWVLRPCQLRTVPYFELPMPISRRQMLLQFCMGSHALLLEQGRLAKPAIPPHLRHRTSRHWVTKGILGFAPSLSLSVASIAHCTKMLTMMQYFVWHKDQKVVCHCRAAEFHSANDFNQVASS